jgi:hypothetical protein
MRRPSQQTPKRKAYMKAYRQTPKNKAYEKARRQDPKRKAYMSDYAAWNVCTINGQRQVRYAIEKAEQFRAANPDIPDTPYSDDSIFYEEIAR